MIHSIVWRGGTRISASALGLLACLGAGSGSTLSQESLAANPAAIQIFEPDDSSLPDGSKACDAHPQTTTILNNLASIYESQGRYDEPSRSMSRPSSSPTEGVGRKP